MDITNEQEVLLSIMSPAKTVEDSDERAELRKVRQRRKMTAAYKAHKALEVMHPEQYETLFSTAYDLLANDQRYTEAV
jgi:hypothetical protein